MNTGRKVNKHKLVIQHRQQQYLTAINGVIDKKFNSNYATLRWQKIKDLEDKK